MEQFPPNFYERFWNKVSVNGPDDCWVWTGARNRSGYGQIGYRRTTIRAHRFSYEIHVGNIPEGMYVLHRCDNPPCVNPAHLFLGTQQDNMNDQRLKGRQFRGRRTDKNHHLTRIPQNIVQEIKNELNGSISIAAISRTYNVSESTVARIRDRSLPRYGALLPD